MTKKTLEHECKKYNPDVDLEGSGEKDLGHSLAERMIQKYGDIEKIPKIISKDKEDKKAESPKKENNLEKGLIFIQRADGLGINPDNLFANRDAKETLIREYKGDKEYLPNFSDYRIGTIFKNLYYALKKSKK